MLDNTGNLYGLGYNGMGQLGTGTEVSYGNQYPFTLLNSYMPGNAKVTDFLTINWQIFTGGTTVARSDGTLMTAGNASYVGASPLATYNLLPNAIPWFTYVPGFGPQNVISAMK